jgi:hypothetical protein
MLENERCNQQEVCPQANFKPIHEAEIYTIGRFIYEMVALMKSNAIVLGKMKEQEDTQFPIF